MAEKKVLKHEGLVKLMGLLGKKADNWNETKMLVQLKTLPGQLKEENSSVAKAAAKLDQKWKNRLEEVIKAVDDKADISIKGAPGGKGKDGKGEKKKRSGPPRGPKAKIFEHSAASVLKWMGSKSMSRSHGKKVWEKYGEGNMAESSIGTYLTDGRNPKYCGEMPNLSKEEMNKIKSLKPDDDEGVKTRTKPEEEDGKAKKGEKKTEKKKVKKEKEATQATE
jgi:hypothetical protein